ncbi:MAG TPA: nucleotide-binding protein [Methanolinea sp.]|mgnify:FL=1|nr:nucleotide-binding protein [Methanolinea sp.]HQK55661.1 nucleotide-binding protein [Methanolinea sp.]
MRRVLDATAFFVEMPLEGELYTSPLVVDELADARSRCRLEALSAVGLQVVSPGRDFIRRVEQVSGTSGDAGVLSPADREILALALELSAEVVSDDFAVQNVAHHLKIPACPLQQRRARKRKWRFRCPGCGRILDGPGECPVCGAIPKRTIK